MGHIILKETHKVNAGNSGKRVISETSKYLAVYQLNRMKLSYEMTLSYTIHTRLSTNNN